MSQTVEVDRSYTAADEVQVVDTESAAAVGSESPISTSSSTKVDHAMVKNKILNLYEYWKEPTVDERDITNFHNVRWLPGGILCTPTTLEFPTIDRTCNTPCSNH
jgi:hypothetical protein